MTMNDKCIVGQAYFAGTEIGDGAVVGEERVQRSGVRLPIHIPNEYLGGCARTRTHREKR